MGYTHLLNKPNVWISYNGSDAPVIDNGTSGSLSPTRTATGLTATFASDSPNADFGSCLVTQNQWQQSWTFSGTPAPLYSQTNERWSQVQSGSGRGWEFWIKIDSSVNLTNDTILLEWIDGSETTRVVLGTDRRIMLTGPLIFTTYMGVGVQSTVYSDPLSLDEWHLISITNINLYAPPGFYAYSFETRASSYLMIDGRIYRHTALTNDALIKNINMPTDLFASISIPGIKFANFAFWETSITHKQHVRRYMYGKPKTSTQRGLVFNSNPWAYNFMDYSPTNNNYVFEGTYVAQQNDPRSSINFSPESIPNNAVDINYQGGIEGTTCLRLTKAQGDPTLINGAGNMYLGTSATPFNMVENWQDQALNTGNYTIEFWYRSGMTQREYDNNASGVSPLFLIIAGNSVVQNVRLTLEGELEYIVKINNTSSSTSTGFAGLWSMKDLSKRIDEEWHHVAIVSTYNNPVLNVKVYIDGALYNNFTNSNCQVLNPSYQVNDADPNTWRMAWFFGAANQYLTYGQMDNFAMYTRQLTEDEIRSRYLNYNIVEKPEIIGVKERKSYSPGSGNTGAGYTETKKNIWQPADIVLYNNGTTFVKNPYPMKYYDGIQWVDI